MAGGVLLSLLSSPPHLLSLSLNLVLLLNAVDDELKAGDTADSGEEGPAARERHVIVG